MAIQHGMAGEWARVRGMVLSLWPLFLSSAFFGAFVASLFLGSHAWLFGALLVCKPRYEREHGEEMDRIMCTMVANFRAD